MSAAEGGPRPLRVMLVANDGLSAGHVARAVAVARGLRVAARARGIALTQVLATTSEAFGIGAEEELAIVRLPPPRAGRRGGLDEEERRRLVRATIAATAASFAPDLLVADTFPSGPHGELASVELHAGAKRAIVRRRVRHERANEPAITRGLEAFDLAIVADDPDRDEGLRLPLRVVHVPPITFAERIDGASRAEARARLGLPMEGRAVLVTAGGGGDADAVAQATRTATSIRDLDPAWLAVLAVGPLAPPLAAGVSAHVTSVHVAPLAPWLAAFDGAIAAAGYNTSHELAKAGVPSALFARERPFDDQRARAQRFAERGLALALDDLEPASIRRALAWFRDAPPPVIEAFGAARAADALLDLACGRATSSPAARATEAR